MDANAQLHELVAKQKLTAADLMELTGRSRTQVYGWLCPQTSKHFKKMRSHDLRLLKLELGLAKPKGLAA